VITELKSSKTVNLTPRIVVIPKVVVAALDVIVALAVMKNNVSVK
jgi:hypothetical protein